MYHDVEMKRGIYDIIFRKKRTLFILFSIDDDWQWEIDERAYVWIGVSGLNGKKKEDSRKMKIIGFLKKKFFLIYWKVHLVDTVCVSKNAEDQKVNHTRDEVVFFWLVDKFM